MWRNASLPKARRSPETAQSSQHPGSTDRIEAADLLATQPAPTPLLIPAISFAVGIALADRIRLLPNLATHWLALALIVGCWLLLAVVIARASRWGRWIALAIGLGLCGVLRMQSAQTLPTDHIKFHLPAKPLPVRLIGTVATPPRSSKGVLHSPFYPHRPDPSVRFLLRVSATDRGSETVPLSGLVQVTVKPALRVPVALGDPVTVTGWLSGITPPLNPGAFDWPRWQARRGVFAQLHVDALDYVIPADGDGNVGLRWQRELRSWVRRLLHGDSAPEDARQLLDVLVLGQRSAADRELNERFIRLGAAPYLAVSGFHVGVLALTVALLGRLILSRQRTAWLVLAVLLTYLAIVEPNPPVLRATLMGVLACIAVIMRRPAATLNWWAASGLILLLINPQYLFDAGFQFTFAMVLVLFTVWPALDLWMRGLSSDWEEIERRDSQETNRLSGVIYQYGGRLLIGTVGATTTLWLASLPIVGLYFGRFAPLGFVGCLLVCPLVIVTIWGSVLSILLNTLFLSLGISVDLSGSLSNLLLAWTQWLDHWIGVKWEMPHVPWLLVLASYLPALFWPLLRELRYSFSRGISRPIVMKANRVLVCLLLPNVVFWSAWSLQPARIPPPSIDILALSRGSGTIVHTGSDALLIDGGTLGNWDAADTIREHLRLLDHPVLKGALLTGQTAGYFSAWPTLIERDRIGWVDLSPTRAANTAAIRRLLNTLDDQPQLTLPKTYAQGACTITQWPTASGKRALVLEIDQARLLYAMALDVEAFTALAAKLAPNNQTAPITAIIAPARSSAAIEQVFDSARQLGAHVLIFHLPPHEPAWQAAIEHTFTAEGLQVINIWQTGAVRLAPETTSPGVWNVIPLSNNPHSNRQNPRNR